MCAIDDLVQIEGEFKNPKLKPWTHINPEEEVKIMWDVIKNERDMKGISLTSVSRCLKISGVRLASLMVALAVCSDFARSSVPLA